MLQAVSAPHQHSIPLPARDVKPRSRGLTMVIDSGLATSHFRDIMASFGDLIDLVKFGWGTCLVTPDIGEKAAAAVDNGVDFYFGGTLFEKFLQRGRLDEWYKLCFDSGASTVEISNGSVDLTNAEKARHVSRFAEDFRVLSEVGFKDPARSQELSPQEWIDSIRRDLDAGASHVITEARESGSSGICSAGGDLRCELIDEIAGADVDLNALVFEAPTKQLQTHLLGQLGPQTNLGNIRPDDVIGVETLRLGLRADTFDVF
ncbi:phosphosulfolactate synthase [Salinifilum ghardaiensis]